MGPLYLDRRHFGSISVKKRRDELTERSCGGKTLGLRMVPGSPDVLDWQAVRTGEPRGA